MCGFPVTEGQYRGKRLDRPQGLSPEKIQGTEIRIYKCSQCRLVYSNPQPVPLTNDQLSTTAIEDFWSGENHIHEHFTEELRVLEQLSKKPLNELLVLDVGFGFGNSLVSLSAKCKEVHGIEPYENFFHKAIELNQAKLDKALLQCVRFEDAVFEKEQFDFIFFEAIQHLPDLSEGMEKVLGWLKPGGIIHIEVTSSSYLFSRLINMIYKLKGNGYVVNTNPMHGNYTYYEFSEKSFRENGKLLGYRLVHHEVLPCNPPVKGILGKLFTVIMKLTDTGMQHSIWLQK